MITVSISKPKSKQKPFRFDPIKIGSRQIFSIEILTYREEACKEEDKESSFKLTVLASSQSNAKKLAIDYLKWKFRWFVESEVTQIRCRTFQVLSPIKPIRQL